MDNRLGFRHRRGRSSRSATDEERMIRELLPPDTVPAIRQVIRDHRRLVDDFLHYSTGLVLEEGRKALRIAVEVDDVLPDCVAKFVASRQPENTRYGGADGYDASLKRWDAEINAALRKAPARTGEQLPLESSQHKSDWLRNSNFVGAMAEFNVDVLGEYDPRLTRICLHGLVIGMVSEVLGLDVRGLALVVLIHEYAHAYTHLGKDIDGNSWLTDDYEKLDLATKEGLAQIYTAHLCYGLDGLPPGLGAIFDRLLHVQHAVYRQYQAWPCQGPHIGECIRMAIINARKRQITTEPEFRVCLDDARQLLS